MSYQATVAVLLNKSAKDKMTDEIQKAFERVFGTPKELDDGEDFLYYLPYGKWAETAKEECAIFDFLHSLEDEDDEWEFCLTGDNDTQEHEGNTDYERLCVETYLSLDGIDVHSIVEEKAQEKEFVHLLLIQYEDDLETYFHVFHTKQGVKDFIEKEIRRDYNSRCGGEEFMSDEDKQDMADEIDDMNRSMDGHGYWDDGSGNRYSYHQGKFEDNKEA